MNIRKLENYLLHLEDTGDLPSIKGLKEYDFNSEMRNRLKNHMGINEYGYSVSVDLKKLIDIVDFERLDILKGTESGNGISNYFRNNDIIIKNIMEVYNVS